VIGLRFAACRKRGNSEMPQAVFDNGTVFLIELLEYDIDKTGTQASA
jgi:hypothetical protein